MSNLIKKTYNQLIAARKEDINFWILFSFLPTFIIARLLVYNAPTLFINIRGTHIHHMAWGIFLLAISGFLAQNFHQRKLRIIIAIFYGIGLALSFDEFGMWLRLKDAYWIRQSYDAIVIISAILINVVYFENFWIKILRLKRFLKESKNSFIVK